MKREPHFPKIATSSIVPIAAAALAIGIFVIDTVTDLEIAVAVFYVAVVLMSVSFCRKRGVMLVSAGCIALTLLSHFLTPTGSPHSGLVNCIISLSAIAATAYLALKIESAEAAVYEARAQLAHISRVTALGQLTASIAHEVNQPLTAVVTSGNACLRWLAAQPPNLEKARQAVERVVKDASRASEVVGRVRGLAKRSSPHKDVLNINEIVLETLALTRGEIEQNRIVLRTQLSAVLPLVPGDRIQLQQVILNLIINAVESMNPVAEGPRELLVSSAQNEAGEVLLAVCDSGTGLDPGKLDHLFDAFYTTKPEGMGMGLTINRSIIEAHGGRIWATRRVPQGAIFQFTLPTGREDVGRSSP
jgi:signal transduction histidine kinase